MSANPMRADECTTCGLRQLQCACLDGPTTWCRCAEVNGGEPIDWRTEKCSVCGLPVMPPGGAV